MDIFWKAILLALITAVLYLQTNLQNSTFAILLTLAATVLIASGAAELFRPVVRFLKQLEAIGSLQEDFLAILLKALGIGITAEIASLICSDAGNASMAKIIQLTANATILYLSIPIFSSLLELLKKLMVDA